MERRCANPLCSQVLQHFTEGKLFIFERSLDYPAEPGEPGHDAEYFWLCQHCASMMTIISDKGQEPTVVCLGTEQFLSAGTA